MSDRDSSHITLFDENREIMLRKSLFWDIPEQAINLSKNRGLIIERILTRGTVEEFRQLRKIFSDRQIREHAVRIGTLDRKTLNFVSRLYQIKPEEFKCYGKRL